jgi:6-phosphogluconolactonase (cycloisomerase 2 family)
MRHKQTTSASPARFAGSILSSEIQITADGRFLYVSNRLHSGVSVFVVAADGQLRMISDTWVHADSPRSIAIDPSGEFLLIQSERRLDHLVPSQRRQRCAAIHGSVRTGGKSCVHDHIQSAMRPM